MPSVVPGTEQALRHSSYVITNHVNTDAGFLPKLQERGVILLVLRSLGCSLAGHQEHGQGWPLSLLSSKGGFPWQPQQLRPGAPVLSLVTASPQQQPVRMAKADLHDGTQQLQGGSSPQKPRQETEGGGREQTANKHRATGPDPETPGARQGELNQPH